MTVELYAAIVSSCVGFLIGNIVGCFLSVRLTGEKADGRRGGKGMAFARPDWARLSLGLVILVLLLVSGIRYYEKTSCQTAYNEAVAEALFSRSEAQRVQTQAQIELLEASLSGNRDLAMRETREYIDANRELERVRVASPYPHSPDCD